MEKNELRGTYREFKGCYSDGDFIEKAADLNRSCEIWYSLPNGIGTQSELDIRPYLEQTEGGWYECDGYICIEVTTLGGRTEEFEVPIEIGFEDWDEEEQCFMNSWYQVKNVEEW